MAQAKRKKRFFDIEIPIIKKETQIQAYEPKELDGRFVSYDLTRFLKGKSALFQIKITVDGDRIISTPRQIKILPYFLRRMVRKGTNYVEDSFSAECKDSVLTIKPFFVTRRKISRHLRGVLRSKAKEEIIEYVKNKDAIVIFEDLIRGDLQKFLSQKMKKIYPLSLCEIRILKVESQKA